jgi:hypothetical protein
MTHRSYRHILQESASLSNGLPDFHPATRRFHPAPGLVHLNCTAPGRFVAIFTGVKTQSSSGPVPAKRAAAASAGRGVLPKTGGRPDFFIVGAPKCGTTAMSDYLGAHPDIFMARKEMHFFGRDLRFASHFYRRAESEYLAEFAGRDPQQRAGEASVWYLFSTMAAAEIRKFNPSARIIIMLREPADMMYSLYHYFRYDGNEPLSTFAEALQAEPVRRAGQGLGRQTYFAQGLAYRDTARFARQVRRYFTAFGRERVRVVLYEDLAADAAAVYRDTLNFLQVDPAFRLPHFPRVNPARKIKSAALQAVINAPMARSAALAMRPLMPKGIFDALERTQSTLRGLNSSTERPQPLAPELRSGLRREFAAEVSELGKLIGRDLSHWTGSDQS